MHLFDAFIYSSFLAAYHGKDKELQRLATEALTAGLNYIRSISEWNSSATMEMFFAGDEERISKPSSSPEEIISADAKELDQSRCGKMEDSFPHEAPIGNTVVEPKGAMQKKEDMIGSSESIALPVFKERVVSPKSETDQQPSTLTELIEKLQNPLASTAESWWLKDLLNLRKDYEDSGSEASLSKLKSRETLLTSYHQFKYKLLSSPDFIMKCETFDSNAELELSTFQDIVVSFQEHPMSSMLEKSLSDELLLLLTLSQLPESPEVKEVLKIKMSEAISHLRKNHDIYVRSLQAFTDNTATPGHDEPSLSVELSRNRVETSLTTLSSFDNEPLSSQTLSPLCLPLIPESVSPVYYEEEDDEDTDPSLLDDYVLMDLEQATTTLPESVDVVNEVPSIIPVSSSPSPSPTSFMEARRGEGMVFNSSPTAEARSSPPPKATVAAGWEGCKGVSNLLQLPSPRLISDDYTPTDEVVSLPPLQLILAAWWEGWKRPSTKFQTQLNKTRVNPHPSHQVSILAAWWEGWKESTTPQLFSCSSLTLLFYLLLLYYMLSKSLLYSVPPAVYDLTNPYDLLSPHHYPIPTGSMGGWVKVPDHYSSIPRAPPWQHRTGSWAYPAQYYYTPADAAKHPQDPQTLHFYHLFTKPTPHA